MNTLRVFVLTTLVVGIFSWRWPSREPSIDRTCDFYRDRYSKQPNIIYIMADDMGWNDVGFHNPKVKTPNIDALRAKGIELTQSYVQPICTPSRSSFVTGKYPSNNGLQALVILANSQTCLPTEHKTIFEYMKDEGYTTKYTGKWHLGDCNSTCLPNTRGIDDFRGILTGSADYFTWTKTGVMVRQKNGVPDTENVGTHLTIQDTNDVQDMIDAHKGERNPLFMWITPTAPHDPLQPTEDMFNVHDFLDENDSETRQRREYLGLLSALDDLVGETMAALKRARMERNTIIVFSSDNGGAAIAPYTGDSPSYANNYPLRNGKYAFTEGGVRTPTIYYDPRLKRSTRGTERDFLVHITDWLPTFVQLASTRPKTENFTLPGIDGVSQLANLGSVYNRPEDRKYNIREEFLVSLTAFDTARYGCATDDAAYRWRDYKLIYGNEYSLTDPDTIPTEWPKPQESPELPDITGDNCQRMINGEKVSRCLFNVVDDPSEIQNLYDVEPELVAMLLAKIQNAKEESVRPAFTESLGANNVTAQTLGDFLVPRHDFCMPDILSPLIPNSPSCF